MSKLGKRPIEIPASTTVKFNNGVFSAAGPKGTGEVKMDSRVKVQIEEKSVSLKVEKKELAPNRAIWGTMWSLVNNVIIGVSAGFEKKLELIGVGYRVAADKQKITLHLGYSHPIELQIPKDMEVTVEKNVITVRGADKQAVGQFSALIRSKREPEPYKGKGIRYSGEVVRRKAGKVMKSVGG
jgi:large subunit ribosomal protein L6